MLGQVEEKGSAMRGSFFISLSPVRNLWFSTKKHLLPLAWQVCSDIPWTILGGYQRGWPRPRYLKYLELITPSHKYQQFNIFPRTFWNWQREALSAICGDYPRYRHPFRCQNLPAIGANTFACTVSMCNKHVNICFCIFVTFLCVKIQCMYFWFHLFYSSSKQVVSTLWWSKAGASYLGVNGTNPERRLLLYKRSWSGLFPHTISQISPPTGAGASRQIFAREIFGWTPPCCLSAIFAKGIFCLTARK